MIEIPLTSEGEQIFSTKILGNTYGFRVVYSNRSKTWSLDITPQTGDPVFGIVLVGGVNLISEHNLPINNLWMVNIDNPSLDPSSDNLGTSCKLIVMEGEL